MAAAAYPAGATGPELGALKRMWAPAQHLLRSSIGSRPIWLCGQRPYCLRPCGSIFFGREYRARRPFSGSEGSIRRAALAPLWRRSDLLAGVGIDLLRGMEDLSSPSTIPTGSHGTPAVSHAAL